MSRDPSAFLEDIEESCTKIINFAGDLSRREVLADPMRLVTLSCTTSRSSVRR